MKPATEIHRVADGLFVWQAWSPECKVDLTSTGIVTDAGLVLIDPITLTPGAMEELVSAAGPVRAVLLTSGNHARDSGSFRIPGSAPVFSHPEAIPELGCTVDFPLPDDAPVMGLEWMALPGNAPGEVAYRDPRGILIVGDALVHLDGLTFLPGKYCRDPREAKRSARRLPELSFDVLCFAHGLPIVRNARERVLTLLGGAE